MRLEVVDVPWNLVSTRRVIITVQDSDLKNGDVVELVYRGKAAVVTVHQVEEDRANTLALDKNLRNSLSVKIGDVVDFEISKVNSSDEAEHLEVLPLQRVRVQVDKVKSVLLDSYVRQGMRQYLPDEGVEVQIGRTRPSGLVKVSQSTVVEVGESITQTTSADSPQSVLSFEDIGGLEEVKLALRENIVYAIEKKSVYAKYGYRPSRGILLYGPPGTGKTMLARALAVEAKAAFRHIAASEIKDKWYGESERRLRETFAEAKRNAPCILFFDEIDAIAESRFVDRVNIVQQLLTLMDEIAESDVFVVAATNKVELIDQGLLRPGRFIAIEVKPPGLEARKQVFRIHLSKTPTGPLNFDELASSTEKLTGAQIMGLCEKAKIQALRESNYSSETRVTQKHIMVEVQKLRAGLDAERPDIYKR